MARERWVSSAIIIAAGLGTAVACAVVLAVIDIYLSGHGKPTLDRPWIDKGIVHLSRADVILLGAVVFSVLNAGRFSWPQSKRN